MQNTELKKSFRLKVAYKLAIARPVQLGMVKGAVVVFNTQAGLTRSLLRFSEFTTKHEFHRYFTLEEYAQSLKISPERLLGLAAGVMVLDYYISDLLDCFGTERLHAEENELLEILADAGLTPGSSSEPFFVIGLSPVYVHRRNRRSILLHEIAHVLFRTQEAYRQTCLKLFEGLQGGDREKVLSYFSSSVYFPEEFANEFQAYILSGDDDFQLDKSAREELRDRLLQAAGLDLGDLCAILRAAKYDPNEFAYLQAIEIPEEQD
jgi:hypothetical protein